MRGGGVRRGLARAVAQRTFATGRQYLRQVHRRTAGPYARMVTRFLGGLGLLAPIALLLANFAMPAALSVSLDAGPVNSARLLVALAIGSSATALLTWLFLQWRLRRLVRAAERLAKGDLDARVKTTSVGVEGRLAKAINGIANALAETTDAATVDRLTGVSNRAVIVNALFTEVERASRYDRPLSVAFVDIDHFKTVNDTYGHEAGDVVLRGVAQTIRSNLRGTDSVGRYGGEEFMLLLTETPVDDAASSLA